MYLLTIQSDELLAKMCSMRVAAPPYFRALPAQLTVLLELKEPNVTHELAGRLVGNGSSSPARKNTFPMVSTAQILFSVNATSTSFNLPAFTQHQFSYSPWNNKNNTHFNSETSLQSTTRCDAVLGPGIGSSVDCLYEVQLPHRLRHLCMWKAHSQSIIPFITSHSGQQVYVTFVTHSLIRGFIESVFLFFLNCLTCNKTKWALALFVLVSFLYILFLAMCARLSWPHSAFECTLNTSIVSYHII